jgi:NADH-quinone oxidoreductase subunit C
MQPAEIFSRLEKQFSGKVSGFNADVPEPYLFVGAEEIVEVCRFLRDDADLKFEVLSDQTAVDWPKEEKIQLVYHLYSYSGRHQIVLKVDLPRDNPKIATVENIWKVANCSSARFSICLGLSSKAIAICAGFSP